jgi:hypothetical protein
VAVVHTVLLLVLEVGLEEQALFIQTLTAAAVVLE